MLSGYFCSACNKDGEDIMIHCFACDKQFHAKCIKINGNLADKIKHDRGFHYYCELHRDLSVSDLLKKIAKLQSFHVEMKLMMDKYKEVLDMNPESELKRLDTIKDVMSMTSSSIAPSASRKLRSSTKKPSANVASTDQQKKKKSDTSQTELPLLIEIDDTACDASEPSISVDVSAYSCTTGSLPESRVDILSTATFAPTCQSRENILVPPKLNCVPRKKSVFLSGCDVATTVQEINDFINFYTGSQNDLNIRKMKFRDPKQYSSFVIDVGRNEQLFEKLCAANFWPKNSIVREYEFFRRPHSQQENK